MGGQTVKTVQWCEISDHREEKCDSKGQTEVDRGGQRWIEVNDSWTMCCFVVQLCTCIDGGVNGILL